MLARLRYLGLSSWSSLETQGQVTTDNIVTEALKILVADSSLRLISYMSFSSRRIFSSLILQICDVIPCTYSRCCCTTSNAMLGDHDLRIVLDLERPKILQFLIVLLLHHDKK
ncbi:unnamed protein product [Amoebophrya sp. A25]|nr:unnamed protein product [Amoebophrya sp. A25]|eukprot:GSA25T00002715001.1